MPRWSLFCCRVTQPCYRKPSGISVVTSLLFSLSGLMSMLSQCCFMVRSDSSDEVLKSGLSSSSHCPRPGLDLNAKNGSEANLWLWWLWPLICDLLCLCLWNMGLFSSSYLPADGQHGFDRVYLDVCYFRRRVWWSAITRNVEWSPGVKGLFLPPSLASVDRGLRAQIHV